MKGSRGEGRFCGVNWFKWGWGRRRRWNAPSLPEVLIDARCCSPMAITCTSDLHVPHYSDKPYVSSFDPTIRHLSHIFHFQSLRKVLQHFNMLWCAQSIKKHICSFPPSAAIDYSSVREVRLSPCRIGDSFEFSGASKLALCIYGVSICQRSTLQRPNVKHFFSFQGILFRIPGLCIDLWNNVLPLQMNKTLYGGNDQTLFRTHSIPTAAIVSCPSLDSDLHKTQKGLMLKVHSYTFIL